MSMMHRLYVLWAHPFCFVPFFSILEERHDEQWKSKQSSEDSLKRHQKHLEQQLLVRACMSWLDRSTSFDANI